MKKRSKILLILLCVITLPIIGFIVLLIISFCYTPETIGKNVDSLEWLPNSASNISYYQRGGFGWIKYAEFDMTKSDFKQFATKNKWDIQEKKDVYISVRNILNEEPLREIHGIKIDIIPNALFYKNRAQNGGGITLVYDLDTHRGYYDASHR